MFHKIRFRLTILSGSITTLILIAMTMCHLYVSEKTLMQSWVLSLENDISTIALNLEQQMAEFKVRVCGVPIMPSPASCGLPLLL